MKLADLINEMAKLSNAELDDQDVADPNLPKLSPYKAYNSALRAKRNGQKFDHYEPHLQDDPEYAYYYARDLLHGRFPEGEAAIARDPEFRQHYQNMINGTPSEHEPDEWIDSYGSCPYDPEE